MEEQKEGLNEGQAEGQVEGQVEGQNDITYHAVEKDGQVTAIWEMKGRKHLRTIDPRSEEGRHILGSHTVDEHTPDDHAQAQTSS